MLRLAPNWQVGRVKGSSAIPPGQIDTPPPPASRSLIHRAVYHAVLSKPPTPRERHALFVLDRRYLARFVRCGGGLEVDGLAIMAGCVSHLCSCKAQTGKTG